jgi:hypothetical protein
MVVVTNIANLSFFADYQKFPRTAVPDFNQVSVGHRQKVTAGLFTSARAIATRCFLSARDLVRHKLHTRSQAYCLALHALVLFE